jgi:hypothetical protein
MVARLRDRTFLSTALANFIIVSMTTCLDKFLLRAKECGSIFAKNRRLQFADTSRLLNTKHRSRPRKSNADLLPVQPVSERYSPSIWSCALLKQRKSFVQREPPSSAPRMAWCPCATLELITVLFQGHADQLAPCSNAGFTEELLQGSFYGGLGDLQAICDLLVG